MTEPLTVAQLVDTGELVLADSTRIFEDHDVRREAEELLAHVIGVDPESLHDDDEPARRLRERYLSLVARRAAGEPFPILTGRILFYGLELAVRAGTFMPRPSSELLVARAAKRLRKRKSPTIVDACTGAGPIALALADEFPDAQVWGTDISPAGLAQARVNARKLSIDNARWRVGDMYSGLPSKLAGEVDVITAHVPYVPVGELDDLPREVRDFEPVFTLTDESGDGLGLMRRAVAEAPGWLRPGGWLLLEMSDDIAPRVLRMCRKAGLEDHGIASDDDGLSVVVEARLPKNGTSSR